MNLLGILMSAGAVAGGLRGLHEALAERRERQEESNGLGLARGKGKYANITAPPGLKMTSHSVRGIDERVAHVVKMIKRGRNDPRIRALAVQIVSQKRGRKWKCSERDYVCECRELFDYVRSHVRYVRDSIDKDTFQAANRTLEFAGGDCDDYTITLGALLQSIGYPVWCRVIQTQGNRDFNHIYLVVGLPPTNPTHKMSLDASVDRPAGWAPPSSMIVKVKDYPVR